MGTGDAFRKTQVEVSYMDAHEVKHYFCTPTHGHRPKEGSNEAMTDTRVLKLLGVQPKIGTKFTVTYQIGGGQSEPKTVTQEFVLSGWWDYNGVSQASNVIVPESYVKKTLQHVEIGEDEESGKWSLDVMFGNALHIEKDMRQVIRDCGFQSEDASKPGYIAFGVNWGYTGAQSSSNLNPESIAAIVALLVLIVFTGYLVIYNVFQISVTNDIRFYGLLKTIGMTGRQLKRIIRLQAVLLSAIGIPVGLLLGFGIGVGLTPAVMAQTTYTTTVIKLHAWVFVGAALFHWSPYFYPAISRGGSLQRYPRSKRCAIRRQTVAEKSKSGKKTGIFGAYGMGKRGTEPEEDRSCCHFPLPCGRSFKYDRYVCKWI